MRRAFEVIVIGGGHAGVEAAWAAANVLGSRGGDAPVVALVTIDPAKIGVMSCNPAIGGLAKGQLVREVDALGGIMGLAADATGINFKVLNTSKGAAVRGPRAQCDKHAYAEAVQVLLTARPEIEILAGTVEELLIEPGATPRVAGVRIASPVLGPLELSARNVVLTTGTFMRGLMHTGESRTPGGRAGEAAAFAISDALRALGFELGRLKTGTPPRLRRSTIRWDDLDAHVGDDPPAAFSDLTGDASIADAPAAEPRLGEPIVSIPGVHDASAIERDRAALFAWANAGFRFPRFPLLEQVDCRGTRTGPEVHAAIRENIHRAPMYSGQIESVGPRYCPSIEDKVVRFAQRDEHTVFLEPESHRDDWVYCNGISTSLPADVQDRIVRGLPGCERAEIYRYGYAVEYDMVRPHQIDATGQTKLVRGLFLAGQINGTSGYEEAAAQGLVAGLNAALSAAGSVERAFSRDEAYIGVLMDDLVTKTPVEPYRMFTSRAEHRLILRADNAADRLTPIAESQGLLGARRDAGLGRRRRETYAARRAWMDRFRVHLAANAGKPLAKLLKSPEFEPEHLRTALEREGVIAAGEPDPVLAGAIRTTHADRRYEVYIERERAEIERRRDAERKPIPTDFDFTGCDTMRTEAREALTRFRPRTFGQAARLEGITPTDLTLLAVLLKRRG